MSKKRHRREGKSTGRRSAGKPPTKVDPRDKDSINEGFQNMLDHVACMLAEQIREATNGWQQTCFGTMRPETVPAANRDMLKTNADWKRFGGYIMKWLNRLIQQDTNGIALTYGVIKVSTIEKDNASKRVIGLVYGYEYQSPAQYN